MKVRDNLCLKCGGLIKKTKAKTKGLCKYCRYEKV